MSSIDLSTQQRSIGIITAAAVAAGYIFYAWFRAQNDGCPVVPYSNPLTGSSDEYRKNPKEFVEKWTQKLGPVYRVHLFGRLHTVVSGRYAREVFLNDNFSFNAGTAKRFDVALMAGISPGEVASDRSRKVIVKFFTPRLKYLTPRATENLSLGLNEMLGDVTKPMEVRHMFPIILRMVARASASIFVGETLCKDPELVAVFQNVTGDIGSMHPRVHQTWMEPLWGLLRLRMWAIGKFSSRVKYYRKKMLDSFTPEIDLRLKNMQDPNWQKPDDVLQSLIEDGAEPGKDLYNYIVSQMMILIFASIHTTSSAGTIVLYRLLENPKLMDEIFREQEEVLQHLGMDPNGKSEDIFTFQATKQMVKLDSVCRESLRLINRYYDLAHTHIGKNKIVLSNGTVIEPDDDVLINAYYNQQSNDWTEVTDANNDRSEFKPYRFLDTGKPATKVGDDYLAFGEGRHACPGRWFAIQQIKSIISLLLRDYNIRPSSAVTFPTDTGSVMPFGSATFEKRNMSI